MPARGQAGQQAREPTDVARQHDVFTPVRHALQQGPGGHIGLHEAGHGKAVAGCQGRAQVARADGVHAEAGAAALGTQAFQVADQAALAGAVGAVAGHATPAGDAGHAHQCAAGTGGLARGLHEGLEGDGRPEQVDLEHAAHDGQIAGVGGVHAAGDPRVGHHQIGQACAGDGLRCHGLHGGAVGHIDGVDGGATGGQVGQGLQGIAVQAHQRDMGAGGQQLARQGLAQASTGTGDDGMAKGQRGWIHDRRKQSACVAL